MCQRVDDAATVACMRFLHVLFSETDNEKLYGGTMTLIGKVKFVKGKRFLHAIGTSPVSSLS